MAVMRPPLRRILVVTGMPRYRHWWMQRDEITQAWRQNSTETSPIPLPMPGTGKPCMLLICEWFRGKINDSLWIFINLNVQNLTFTTSGLVMSRISSNSEKACRPKPPFDAVIHSPMLGFFLPVWSRHFLSFASLFPKIVHQRVLRPGLISPFASFSLYSLAIFTRRSND